MQSKSEKWYPFNWENDKREVKYVKQSKANISKCGMMKTTGMKKKRKKKKRSKKRM